MVSIWSAKTTNVIKQDFHITLNYDLMKDGNVIFSDGVHMEGDNIELGVVVAKVVSQLKRLKGVDENTAVVEQLIDIEYKLNDDETDIVPV